VDNCSDFWALAGGAAQPASALANKAAARIRNMKIFMLISPLRKV
jgi:hypothetical protein